LWVLSSAGRAADS